MSLTQALSTALNGLNVAQAGLSITASNIANAQTPGYVRKSAVPVETMAGPTAIGVQISTVNRILDQYVQAQLRTESAGASYADMISSLYSQIQSVYGSPGADSSLETVFNNFTGALQALQTSPDDSSTQTAVISSAQVLTQTLNSMTDSLTALRSQAELGISNDVTAANTAMQEIATLNQQINGSAAGEATTATLEDQRDNYIDQLSKLLDIRVVKGDNDQLSVFTTTGVQLVSGPQAAQLSFNAQGAVTPQSQWNADPTKSSLGTITLTSPGGSTTDLIASHSIGSGEIAAYLDMRDTTIPQAQAQLDQMAAAMSSALSDTQTDGTPAGASPPDGFDIDTGSLLNGNSVKITYTDNTTSTQHTITLVRVDDPSALPLSNTDTADPNDTVYGIDFSGGMASVVSQVNAAIGSTNMVASNPSGNTLEIVDDGAPNLVDVNSVTSTNTATSLTGGSAQLPFFLDGTTPYSGAFTGAGSQSVGLAGRITVNSALIADPSALVDYTGSTPSGDATRPNFIYDQLVNNTLSFSPTSGIGTTVAPFSGTLGTYLQQVISQQAQAANNATSLQQGQDVVLNSLQQRMNSNSGVNIDEEMSNLLNLQNSYAANARVMSTVKEMLDTLMQMMQ
jgi:flagellar hook-associated protein 1